ncbi:hypothetical protein DM02DRAFT_615611 [Periconia macrospinosa]|uniref:Pyridoxal phosphate homeostasis protein n=1 Tax=Periconia macrospinosa TaxID=97972 RepID=A0A2V1DM08_9PLEO|nr:hypothetical protein DM02DRAFT_615611 [Periconia macrospinosa]
MADTQNATNNNENESAETMQINPQRAKQLVENVTAITKRIEAANKSNRNIRLIAVSKLKPASDILALHQPQPQPQTPAASPPSSPAQPFQTHFGENYVQELLEKSRLLPRSIRWHFIGGLQSNKCKQLAEQIPNLWCVSSVDSIKKCNELEKGRKALLSSSSSSSPSPTTTTTSSSSSTATEPDKLRIMVQINTSGEESKSGVEPADALPLCQHIINNCPSLHLAGFMTIGAIARSHATTPENENEDFVALRRVRADVAKGLGWDETKLELSMGMSADFEGAIAQGSDEVRVGSQIFGERPPKKDAVV